jgi:hypothetical protein
MKMLFLDQKAWRLLTKEFYLVETRVTDVVDSSDHGRAQVGAGTFKVAVEEDSLTKSIHLSGRITVCHSQV